MALNRVEYMRWAKALPGRTYALATSGVTTPEPAVFDPGAAELRLAERDTYGLDELIEAIATRYEVAAERVLPLPGASMANFVAAGVVLRRGDRILLETPVYEPMLRMVEFLDLEVLTVSRNRTREFRLDLNAVETGLSQGARAVLLSDPHNPSGLLCPEDDRLELVRMTAEHNAHLIVDEVYRDYAAVNRRVELGPTAAAFGDHVIVTNSLTKVYGLGPLRAGWMLAAPAVIERGRDLFDQLGVINSLPTQQIAISAFANLDRLAARTRAIYEAGYPVYREWLDSRDDVEGYGNDGAVFEFPRIIGIPDTGPLCHILAHEHDVSIVPGWFFGGGRFDSSDEPWATQAAEHVRISFTLPPDVLAEGFARISTALDRIRTET